MDDPETILQEVRPFLSHWDINPVSIALVSHSENIVYKVTAQDGEQFALRVHRPGYHTLAELESEQIWTDALVQFGMRIPRAYPTKSGDYYVSAECGESRRQMDLIAWLEGEPLAKLIASAGNAEFPFQMIEQAGAICAWFHNQATSWSPPPGFTRHQLNIEGLMGESPFWGRFWEAPLLTTIQRRTITRQRDTIIQRLMDYGERSMTYSMIHADLHAENLFVVDNKLMVIDFDDAGFGWHQYDLAVALFSFTDRSDFDAIRAALLKGYRAHRALSDEDLSMVELFILVRTLALIGWASARPELGKDEYLPYLIDQACRSKFAVSAT